MAWNHSENLMLLFCSPLFGIDMRFVAFDRGQGLVLPPAVFERPLA